MKRLWFLAVLLAACATRKEPVDSQPAIGPEPEAYALSGKPLYAKPADSVALVKADSMLAVLSARNPLTEDDYVEMGRQYVSTGRFLKAIDTYTDGLRTFPDSFKLLRHRGHRYLSVRQWEKAIVDLDRARQLINGQPDVWEYDAQGKPSATYQHQIWYHLGLYHYLIKSYQEAAEDYAKSVAAANGDPKNMVGATDWLYNCLMRSGQKDKAAEALKTIPPDLNTDREHPYFRRLMLYKGVIKPEELIDENKPTTEMTVLDITKLYGLANWYRYQGNAEKADSLCAKILETKNWEGFAYAGAEVDLRK